MCRYISRFFLHLLLVCTTAYATHAFGDPWFTGPLLAPAGHTTPRGHTNLEIYALDVLSDGQFDEAGRFVRGPLFRTFVADPILSHGVTDWLDVQLTVPYVVNSTQGVSYNRLGDVGVTAGIQLLEQKKSNNRFDLRLLLQEIIPTGRYDQLNPAFLGTDATGFGSYQTQIALNFQYLRTVFTSHYLRTRLILAHFISSSVFVQGFNGFGGSFNTLGTVNPGTEEDIDLAFEYTLTQHWVAVLEGYVARGQEARFQGILSLPTANLLDITPIGYRPYSEAALAPAIEYNFNSNIGVIGGVWFPISGKNTPHYMTYVVALNMFW